MKSGIIFDMDGTLWDSSEQVVTAWNESVKKYGYGREPITSAEMQAVMGKPMDELSRILFPGVSDEQRALMLDTCGREENDYLRLHGGNLYPAIQKTLETLKNKYHLYIVSNCQSGYIEAFLDYYQFHDLFEDIECFGNNGFSKGDNIALVCKRNGLDNAVYVGDIQGDYDASRQAGVQFIHAAYGFGRIDEKVPSIGSFSELTEVVGQILGE